MAEAAQAEPSAAISPTGIKQEPNPFAGFDFSMLTDTASKRPLESAEATIETPEAKRLKGETDVPEEMYEDVDISALMQNSMTNIQDILSQFGKEPESQAVPTTEAGATDGLTAHDGLDLLPPPVNFSSDPTKFVRDSNINALGSIAISMLLILSQTLDDDMASKLRDVASEHRRNFDQLHASLKALRGLYSTSPVLQGDDLDPEKAGRIISFTNLAQLGAWILDDKDEAIREADSHALAMFRDEILGLPKRIVDVVLGVKTLRAVKAMQAKEDKKLSDEDFNSIFLDGLSQKLMDQNNADQILGSEQTVTGCLRARMDELKGQGVEASTTDKYSAEQLIKCLGQYAKNQLSGATELGDKLGFTMPIFEYSVEPPPAEHEDPMDIDDLSSFFEKTASGLVESALAGLDDDSWQQQPVQNGEDTNAIPVTTKPEEPAKANGFITDYKELEALVAESTSNYVKTTLQGLSPAPYQPTVPTSTTESMAAQTNYMHSMQHQPQNSYYTSFPQAAPEQDHPPPAPGQMLPPNQSCSSAILYERARQAALSRQTAHTRREGLHSTRRPWSQEEEKALMTGLDMVKGPHWSQILSLFGANGSISDILKDRTQVQLKDKARNLKLFFLKTNSEMPYYLSSVTGELKTRAPTQAARKEAEERARMNSEEDHSKLQGIMALAGNLQQQQSQSQNTASTSAAGTVGSGVMTPAQAAAQASAASQNRPSGQVSATPTPASTTASTPTSQNRPQGPAMPQPPARPQNQLPPQIPRPQPQPQMPRPAQQAGQPALPGGQNQQANAPQQQSQQPAMPQTSQQPQQQQPAAQVPPSPHHHGSSISTPTNTSAHQSPVPASATQPQHQWQQGHATSQSPAPGIHATQSPSTPVQSQDTDQTLQSGGDTQDDDPFDEAAIIRNLQAAVAQTIS